MLTLVRGGWGHVFYVEMTADLVASCFNGLGPLLRNTASWGMLKMLDGREQALGAAVFLPKAFEGPATPLTPGVVENPLRRRYGEGS